MRSSSLAALIAVVLGVMAPGCRDLQLPPPPGLGSLTLSVVYAVPGLDTPVPARQAKASLSGSTLVATADENGRISFVDLGQVYDRLLISFDADGDGTADHQRLLDLTVDRVGPGRDVFLGTVPLSRNAEVAGKVLRGDRATLSGGHLGLLVFVPEGPYQTTTNDDGSFLLSGLPEGPLTLAAFGQGYTPQAQFVTLRGGERFTLSTIVLSPSPGSASVGDLAGTIVLGSGGPAADVRVVARGPRAAEVTSKSDGTFVFAALDVGVYSLRLERVGLRTLLVPNALVVAGQNQLGRLVMSDGDGGDGAGTGTGGSGSATGGGSGASGGGTSGGGPGGGGSGGGSASGGGTTGGGAGGGSASGGGTTGAGGGTYLVTFETFSTGGVTGELDYWDGGSVCGAQNNCSLQIEAGTRLRLHARADHPWAFPVWSVPCSTSPSWACVVDVTEPLLISLRFDRPNLVFVTEDQRPPSDVSKAGEPSVVLDDWCTAQAADAGLPGQYVAWVAYKPTDGGVAYDPQSTLVASRGWIRPDGLPVLDRLTALDQPLYLPSLTQRGQLVPSAYSVATGIQDLSTAGPAGHCVAFSSASLPAANLVEGNPRHGGIRWTGVGLTPSVCAMPHRFFCFGRGQNVPVGVDRTSATRRAFASLVPYVLSPDGGLAAADSRCQADATTLGYPGQFRALLPAFGQSAAMRFDLGGPPWARADGVLVADGTALSLTTGELWAPVENSPQSAAYVGVFSGTTGPGVTGSTPCANWTSVSPIHNYALQYATSADWFNYSLAACADTHLGLYCFEK